MRPKGKLAISGGILGCRNGKEEVEGVCYSYLMGKSSNAAKRPTMHRTVPRNKEFKAPNVNGAETKTLS